MDAPWLTRDAVNGAGMGSSGLRAGGRRCQEGRVSSTGWVGVGVGARKRELGGGRRMRRGQTNILLSHGLTFLFIYSFIFTDLE